MLQKIFNKYSVFIKKIFFKINFGKKFLYGENLAFRKGFTIQIAPNAKIKIGDNCFFNNYCSLNCLNQIEIGDDCIFGENVKIYDHNHIFNINMLIRKSGFKNKKIKIGKNCWIGTNAIILKGANIGNNCVIGANCVVSENIEDDTLVIGERILKKEKINKYD